MILARYRLPACSATYTADILACAPAHHYISQCYNTRNDTNNELIEITGGHDNW